MWRNSEIFCLILLIISLMVLGCGPQQAPPPAAPPPAGTSQPGPAPAPSVAAPQPGAPPPAEISQTVPSAPPSQDFNQLRLGMTSEQAKQIKGEPGETKQGKSVTRWFYSRPQGKVEVRIKNNQVVAFELE